MSVSSLPEWKQLLLEKKRREEEERERRGKEEEEKLASMPAWKRGIIQRRKAKQESVCQWQDADPKSASQVSVETIVPVHKNPFMRTQKRERPEEDQQGKRAMKMDLREILASGGSVTEIRASEVLIIKPPVNPEERNTGGKARDDGDMKSSMDVRRESLGRELRTDISWLKEKEKEPIKEKERPWGQATVIKEDRKDTLDDVFVERGGRVSQLLSKFGEHPKPPSRSKSSDNFLRHGRRKFSGDEDEQQSEERKADERNMLLKSVPRRSLSFSDRVICTKENGLDDEWCYEGKLREKIHSNKSVAPWVDLAGLGKDSTAKIKLGCAPLFDEDRFGKQSNYKMSPHRVSSPTSQVKQTITVNPSFLKNQSPDNSPKPSHDAPTPASSRSSPSPAPSPSVSQSPTPSPPLFSIKSASGGNVKRGATITINPKRHAAGEAMGSSTGAASAGSTSSKAPSQQPQTTTAVTEPPKKKYPTVEEIEVIGGYQNLEKSCLVKKGGTPKKVMKLNQFQKNCHSSFPQIYPRWARGCHLKSPPAPMAPCHQAESPLARRTSL
uniref:Phostensin/Taperin PP1-binding domain-containing protein n=1 Tax=Echeneis naucrates TaxID=173247 RepID=A0A665VP49_ECHNA